MTTSASTFQWGSPGSKTTPRRSNTVPTQPSPATALAGHIQALLPPLLDASVADVVQSARLIRAHYHLTCDLAEKLATAFSAPAITFQRSQPDRITAAVQKGFNHYPNLDQNLTPLVNELRGAIGADAHDLATFLRTEVFPRLLQQGYIAKITTLPSGTHSLRQVMPSGEAVTCDVFPQPPASPRSLERFRKRIEAQFPLLGALITAHEGLCVQMLDQHNQPLPSQPTTVRYAAYDGFVLASSVPLLAPALVRKQLPTAPGSIVPACKSILSYGFGASLFIAFLWGLTVDEPGIHWVLIGSAVAFFIYLAVVLGGSGNATSNP